MVIRSTQWPVQAARNLGSGKNPVTHLLLSRAKLLVCAVRQFQECSVNPRHGTVCVCDFRTNEAYIAARRPKTLKPHGRACWSLAVQSTAQSTPATHRSLSILLCTSIARSMPKQLRCLSPEEMTALPENLGHTEADATSCCTSTAG